MRLLHIVSGDIWAGAESQVYNMLCALKEESDAKVICVLFNDGILKRKLEEADVSTHVIDESKYSTIRMFLLLRSIVRNVSPDLIHVHHIKEHLLGYLCGILRFHCIPVVRTIHGRHAVLPGLPFFRHIRSTINVNLDKVLVKRCCQAVIAVSRDLEKHLMRQKIKPKVHLIYNALDVDKYLADTRQAITPLSKFRPPGVFWIGTAARLVRPKNLDMLIDAGAILKKKNGFPFRISIFGDGPLKEHLEERIRHHKLEKNIKLHGFVDGVINVIRMIDVFVLCSFHEGLPMALLEAMLLEKAVVCTRVGGMQEVVENELNGLLVESKDAPALAEALIKIHSDESFRKNIQRSAKHTIIERFSMQKMVKSLMAVYEKLYRESLDK